MNFGISPNENKDRIELDVDILSPFDFSLSNLSKDEEKDETEMDCSSSFGNSLASDETDIDLSSKEEDNEVDSLFRDRFDSDVPVDNAHSEPSGKKALNLEWKLYRKGIEWRVRWLELRMKFLHRQAKRYDRLLNRLEKNKKLECELKIPNDSNDSNLNFSSAQLQAEKPPVKTKDSKSMPISMSTLMPMSMSMSMPISMSKPIETSGEQSNEVLGKAVATSFCQTIATGLDGLVGHLTEKTNQTVFFNTQENGDDEKSGKDGIDGDEKWKEEKQSDEKRDEKGDTMDEKDENVEKAEEGVAKDVFVAKNFTKSMDPISAINHLLSDESVNPVPKTFDCSKLDLTVLRSKPIALESEENALPAFISPPPCDSNLSSIPKLEESLSLINESMVSARTRAWRLARRTKRKYMHRRARRKSEFDESNMRQLARHPLFSRYMAGQRNKEDLDGDDRQVALQGSSMRYVENLESDAADLMQTGPSNFSLYPPHQHEDSSEYLLGRIDEIMMRVENLKYQLCRGQGRKSTQTNTTGRTNQRIFEPISPEPNMQLQSLCPPSQPPPPIKFEQSSEFNVSPLPKPKPGSYDMSDRFGSYHATSNLAQTYSEGYGHTNIDDANVEFSLSRNSSPSLLVGSAMHRKKISTSAYDIDNMVMSVNVGMKFVEQVKHEHIDIPSWCHVSLQRGMIHTSTLDMDEAESSEDTDDEVYIKRHCYMEMKEKMNFHGIHPSKGVKESQKLKTEPRSMVHTWSSPTKSPPFSLFSPVPKGKRQRKRIKARDMSGWTVPHVIIEKDEKHELEVQKSYSPRFSTGEASRSTSFLKEKQNFSNSQMASDAHNVEVSSYPPKKSSQSQNQSISNQASHLVQSRIKGRIHPSSDTKGKKLL